MLNEKIMLFIMIKRVDSSVPIDKASEFTSGILLPNCPGEVFIIKEKTIFRGDIKTC